MLRNAESGCVGDPPVVRASDEITELARTRLINNWAVWYIYEQRLLHTEVRPDGLSDASLNHTKFAANEAPSDLTFAQWHKACPHTTGRGLSMLQLFTEVLLRRHEFSLV